MISRIVIYAFGVICGAVIIETVRIVYSHRACDVKAVVYGFDGGCKSVVIEDTSVLKVEGENLYGYMISNAGKKYYMGGPGLGHFQKGDVVELTYRKARIGDCSQVVDCSLVGKPEGDHY